MICWRLGNGDPAVVEQLKTQIHEAEVAVAVAVDTSTTENAQKKVVA